jgi:phage gp29-like protein
MYAYKAYDVRDMQRFLEMYGLPLRLGKYPLGIGNKEINALLRAVRSIGHDGAGIVPETMSIDFVQATKTGTVTDFLSAIAYWERKQSVAILGGTLTSQADGKTSTNALGTIHDKVRREIMLHDVRQIEPTLTEQLVKPIALLNGLFAEDRIPKWAYQTEEALDQEKIVKVFKEAVSIGLEIDLDWAHNALQIPRAGEGATKLKAAAGAPREEVNENDENNDENEDDKKAALKRRAVLSREEEGAGLTAAYAAQMAALCAPFEQAVIDRIAAVIAEAGDFDAALEGIEALKRDEKNYEAWAQTMAQGLTAAQMAGIDAAKKNGR